LPIVFAKQKRMVHQVGCTFAIYLSAEHLGHLATTFVHRMIVLYKQASPISSPLASDICSTRYLHVSDRARESESEN
jgi:hypothetical protein